VDKKEYNKYEKRIDSRCNSIYTDLELFSRYDECCNHQNLFLMLKPDIQEQIINAKNYREVDDYCLKNYYQLENKIDVIKKCIKKLKYKNNGNLVT
jgi:hypothetical protein|tara:strand:- start:139 stop:426 length:288 start_codon:yes stop_codon:yes gene_type:complete